MVSQMGLNGRGATKRLMPLAKVVSNHKQSSCVTVIIQLAGKAHAKAREASVKRPDAQIEPFNVACANLVNVRLASNGFEFNTRALRLAVTMIRVNV